ncbi:MAG: hypothetical protein O3A95_04860 [Planctomycetota bacterium]|nr:hypothetical protein [Planctomycetota bacterium]MDA1113614.1 hypothetical protein [Planctomycetota bacterium]
MKSVTSLLLLFCLAACEKEEVIPNFDDPVAALVIADAAIAANHPMTAEAGFAYALEHGSEEMASEALFGLLDVHLRYGKTDQGLLIFDCLVADHMPLLSAEKLRNLCNLAITANMAELGEPMLQLASEEYPELQDRWIVIDEEYTRIRTLIKSGGLSQIGCAHD